MVSHRHSHSFLRVHYTIFGTAESVILVEPATLGQLFHSIKAWSLVCITCFFYDCQSIPGVERGHHNPSL